MILKISNKSTDREIRKLSLKPFTSKKLLARFDTNDHHRDLEPMLNNTNTFENFTMFIDKNYDSVERRQKINFRKF